MTMYQNVRSKLHNTFCLTCCACTRYRCCSMLVISPQTAIPEEPTNLIMPSWTIDHHQNKPSLSVLEPVCCRLAWIRSCSQASAVSATSTVRLPLVQNTASKNTRAYQLLLRHSQSLSGLSPKCDSIALSASSAVGRALSLLYCS